MAPIGLIIGIILSAYGGDGNLDGPMTIIEAVATGEEILFLDFNVFGQMLGNDGLLCYSESEKLKPEFYSSLTLTLTNLTHCQIYRSHDYSMMFSQP